MPGLVLSMLSTFTYVISSSHSPYEVGSIINIAILKSRKQIFRDSKDIVKKGIMKITGEKIESKLRKNHLKNENFLG